MSSEIVDKVRKAAVLNALKHDCRADAKAVLGGLLGENPDLRPRAKELFSLVQQVVLEVNSTPAQELEQMVRERWPQELTKERPEEEKVLPPLPSAQKYHLIVTRLAPNPDFVLHIGNARAAILSHDYAKMYKGKFVLRFEDTDPRLKKAQLVFYDLIREDLRWLGCEWDEEYIQSDRLLTYYEVAESLLRKGAAYVCECQPDEFRALVGAGKVCPDRDQSGEEQMQRWNMMLGGRYHEGAAVFRIKTDLAHPNPAVREWPAFRIIDPDRNPHPRVGSKYRVWPLYNLASGVDDHLMRITHVIRGKEHLTNMARQLFLYGHLGWEYPDAVHYGRLKVEGTDLSKSRLMKALESGEYWGIDDPRLGTLAALRRRGFSPETIRHIIWEVGPRPVDVTISWDNIYAQNRKLIDQSAHRYYFVPDPLEAHVEGVGREYVVQAPLHPQHSQMGFRTLRVQSRDGVAELYLAGSDASLLKSAQAVRLMGLFNFKALAVSDGAVKGRFLSEAVDEAGGIPVIQWVPKQENVPVEVVMPDASIKQGLAEKALALENVGAVAQLVRFGFCRVDGVTQGRIRVYFAHE